MKTKNQSDIKEFLDEAVLKYNRKSFIEADPVSIPHLFSKKEDIEISGFLAATIAWGNRKSILKNGNFLMQLMEMEPYNFVSHASEKEIRTLKKFVHRTFNGDDCVFFIKSLRSIYKTEGGLEASFTLPKKYESSDFPLKERIINFRQFFLKTAHLPRSEKHISDPEKKSSAKRLCMFLRWMVRNDKNGVDFGLWKNISPSELCLPLDVHTGNVSRALGLLKRNQNDWAAVEEITSALRAFDPNDPVKYDFALFGLGADGFMKQF